MVEYCLQVLRAHSIDAHHLYNNDMDVNELECKDSFFIHPESTSTSLNDPSYVNTVSFLEMSYWSRWIVKPRKENGIKIGIK